ncbi:MAG: hypothetical protein WC516_05495 [Patescibacteria group bacterium]|jgi:hypothetical protein
MQKTEAKLDPQTNEVICEACGNPIDGITKYTKKAIKDVGQILRNTIRHPFQALCKACNVNRPLYVDGGDRAFCKICNTQVQIPTAFLCGLKEYLEKKEE